LRDIRANSGRKGVNEIIYWKGVFAMKRAEQEQLDDLFNLDPQRKETIRRRAFQIYQQRGMTDGLDVEDWLQAESELLESERRPSAA
jgi:hypothetical protein